MSEIRNARIARTMLGREDHGILTFMLYVDLGGISTGIGGYALDRELPIEDSQENPQRIFSVKGLEAISRILEVVGVRKWEDLPGSYIRVEDDNIHQIQKIGHLLYDQWFNLREFFSNERE